MTNFDIDDRTILLCNHGSHSYGLATETSDVDMKGICIEPLEYHLGFLQHFDQHIREVRCGHPTDTTIFSLKKFAKLAADSNPNIIEVLFCDDNDVIISTPWGDELREKRDMFLSTKAKFTFSGYAYSQLKRIKTHRGWLLNPPQEPPSRKDFGLSTTFAASRTELGAFEALVRDGEDKELSKEAQVMFTRERAYKTMVTQWGQYQDWKKNRNPARAALEANVGYDTKHAMHLLRLMRMCKEILRDGKVIVRRPDREELLAIKRGEVSYEVVVEEADCLERECDELYLTSPLPKKVDLVAIDEMIVRMTSDFLKSKNEL